VGSIDERGIFLYGVPPASHWNYKMRGQCRRKVTPTPSPSCEYETLQHQGKIKNSFSPGLI